MSRVRKGVTSDGKRSTPHEESGSDSNGEIFVAKPMATIAEKFSGLDKRLGEMNRRLTRLEQSRSADEAGVQVSKSRSPPRLGERRYPSLNSSNTKGHRRLCRNSSLTNSSNINGRRRRTCHCYSINHFNRRPSRRCCTNSNGCPYRPTDQDFTTNPLRVQEQGI